MIYRNIRNNLCDVARVNSKQKKKADDKYFREFVSDAINTLMRSKKTICFYKEQVLAIEKVLKIKCEYNKINNWWEVYLDEN